MSTRDDRLVRWRLVLGDAAGSLLDGRAGMTADDLAADSALAWLYERGDERAERDLRDRGGGLGGASLPVPDWLSEVHRLFPKETIERIERDAIEKYQIHEVVTDPEVLARVEPNETLLRAVLLTKHLMNAEVLAMARELCAKVVRKLMEKLARSVKTSFHGTRARARSRIKIARNLDAKATIRANLGMYDRASRRLFIRTPLFVARTRKHLEKWQIIVLVDESGSMVGSIIHAAVTAACLWGLPSMKTHLCIFDTEVVDLTDRVTDPVEVLMKVQLGGGTDIGKAVGYAQGLIENPRRTIVVLVTDFFEGASQAVLVARVKALCDQGVIVLGLAALDAQANPSFDRELSQRLAQAGAHIGAMTPGQLVSFLAEKVRA
ncbi:VWA domain-containing protein [Pendulispora albinea]|uniref:VWA domain-containing protein n=1 Tax=Pendulispora albinea TaxID=2741071 RepID=A0ABZ2M6A9_9BACT